MSTSSVRQQFLEGFRASKEYRHSALEESVRSSLAVQIKALREQRGLTQAQFAERLGKAQSWVARLEDLNQSPPSLSTLLSIAEALDISLDVQFRPFSALLDRLASLTPESFEVPSFADDAELAAPDNGSGEAASRHVAAVYGHAEP